MAEKKIVSSVFAGGAIYTAGQEDKLEAVLPPEDAKRLVKEGVLSGSWKGNADVIDDDGMQIVPPVQPPEDANQPARNLGVEREYGEEAGDDNVPETDREVLPPSEQQEKALDGKTGDTPVEPSWLKGAESLQAEKDRQAERVKAAAKSTKPAAPADKK
jgi:hypothetical protein